MKKLTILLFAMGCVTAFGQAMMEPTSSLQYRQFADNAEPLGHKIADITTFDNSQNVAVIVEPNNEFTALTIGDVRATLNERMMLLQNEPAPIEPINNDQAGIINNNAAGRQDLTFTVFPNPTRDQFTISSFFIDPQSINLRIYDASGNLVSEIMKDVLINNELNQKLDVSSYSAGQYTVMLQVGEQITTQPLIITK